MKNLMVSYSKMTEDLLSALNSNYPDGYDHATFEFEIPTKNEVYTAVRVELEGVNYVIKLDKREKNIDRIDF
ncbi:MAG: hypothetical protein ACPGWM_10800 [Flavobacteriales bacterium]